MKTQHILAFFMALAPLAAAAQTITASDDGSSVRLDGYEVTQTPDRTVVAFDIVLDSLRVPSNRYRAFTPILRSTDHSQTERLTTIIVTGRTQDIVFQREGIDERYAGNCVTMRRHNGTAQSYHYHQGVARKPWHDTADVLLEADLCGCGDEKSSALNYLSTLVRPNPQELIQLVNVEPSAIKRSQELHGSAFITFMVNKWELRPDYMNNPVELRKITDTLDIMVADANVTVEQIKIHGWASPEGSYSHNALLAQNRAQALTDWVRQKYGLPQEAFAPAESTPENWISLRQLVEQASTDVLPHREEILSIIADVNLQPDPKEQRIRQRYPRDYQYMLQQLYPQLRRSDYDITFRVRTFTTTDECLAIYADKPQQLSLHEFWRVAQTFAPFSDDYNRAVEQALHYYPQEEAARVNMANVALHQGNLQRAASLLEGAGDGGAAESARAVLCILQGDYAKASAHLDRAAAQGIDVTANREAVRILQQ